MKTLIAVLILAVFSAAQEAPGRVVVGETRTGVIANPCGEEPKHAGNPGDTVITSHAENPCPTLKVSAPNAHISSVDGPCLQIVGTRCYNAYKSGGQDWFGRYDFKDKYHKVVLIEKFDCNRPNGRRNWTNGSRMNGGSYPAYNSLKVKGLYTSCYSEHQK